MSLICLDQKVLLKKDNCYKIVVVKENQNCEIDRVKFKLNNLIGCAYGTSFTVERGNLVKVGKSSYDKFEKSKVEEILGNDDIESVNLTRDNRHVDSKKRNQMLTNDEIVEMRKNGASGQTILDTIIENSASFAGKTTFAQEKYLKKKKKRYMPTLSVHRITTRMLCELYAVRNKLKIMNLRIDSVSQILSYANVHHGARVLMSETCAGLLLGSVLERGGKVVNFYNGSAPVLPENYSEWRELDEQVYNLPLAQLVPLARTGQFVNHVITEPRQKQEEQKEDVLQYEEDTTERRDVEDGKDTEGKEETVKKREFNGRKRHNESTEKNYGKRVKLSPEILAQKKEEQNQKRQNAKDFLLKEPIDSLIIATKYHPSLLTLTMLEFLAPGKPFVVYCQFLQPLVDLYDDLHKKAHCCSLRITESWLRDYQVLSDRTHPEMNMSGTGGYLLTGLKLKSD